MSKYTTEVRFLCEVESGNVESKGFNSIDNILTQAAPKIFNFDFPMFDENYRLPLEKKILRHYYTREICEETVGLWKLRLQDKLNMIMPYYNKLYKSELIEFNPLYDVDYTREHSMVNQGEHNTEEVGNTSSNEVNEVERSQSSSSENSNTTSNTNLTDSSTTSANKSDTDSTGESSNTNSETNNNVTNGNTSGTAGNTTTDKYSDTPQGSVANIDLTNNAYLTNARIIQDNGSNSGTSHNVTSGDSESVSIGNSSNSSTTNESGTSNRYESSVNEGTSNQTSISDLSGNEKGSRNNSVNTTKTNVGNITNTEEYIEHVYGKQAGVSKSKLLDEFRKTFLNIDKMVIDELSTLFFGLW